MKTKIKVNCISCFKSNLDKDTIALNRKLLGKDVEHFYCLDCLAKYLNTTTDELLEKIEQFKEDGCTLFM